VHALGMNFTFLVWLLALLLCAALLGITMYSLISLSDLENDFVNPHDSSISINRWVVRRGRRPSSAVRCYQVGSGCEPRCRLRAGSVADS